MTERPNLPRGADDDDLRDPHVDALWQATQADGPPARIDAALRAAARREIAGPERKVAMVAQAATRPEREGAQVAQATRPERWWWPLAAAAVIGVVAVGILQLAPDEPSDRAVVSDMPATAKRKAEVATDKLTAPSDNDAARAKTAPLNARQEQPKTPASSNELREEPAAVSAQQQRAQPKQDAYASDKAQPSAAPSAGGSSLQRYRETDSATGAAKDTRGAPVTGALEAGKLQGGGGAAPAVGSRAIERDNAPARPASGVLPPPASPASPIAAPTEQAAQARSEAKERAPEPFPAGAVAPSTAPLPKANAAGAADGTLDEGAAQRRDMLSDRPPAGGTPPAAAAPGAAAGGAMPASPALAKKAFNAQAPVSDDAKAQVRPVPEWIALIRRLRDENKVDEAAKELTAFRAAYPDADKLLPQDLRDWRPAKP